MDIDSGRLDSSLQGISAYGSPLMHADISIFSNGEWNLIGRSGADGSFIIPPNDNIELPALLRAQLTSRKQLEMIEASENTEETLSGEIQTITFYGVIFESNQKQVSITPWSTAALSNAVGQHIATLSDEEVEQVYPSNFIHSSEISDEMKEMLSSYFEAFNIPSNQDPMAMVFETDGTGFDGILDMFDFSVDFQSGEIIIHNRITQQSASVTSQEVMDIDNDLFDINNQNHYSSSKVTQWQESFADYFNQSTDTNIREIVDAHYLNNTITLNGIQEEFESYKNSATPITIHLPRIKNCDTETDVCEISAIVSIESIEYAENRTLYLKFADDGRARLYGNQFNGTMPVKIQPALSFRQNIQNNIGPINELHERYTGFKVIATTSPLWHNKFIPTDVNLIEEYDNPNSHVYNYAHVDYTPVVDYDARILTYLFYLNNTLACSKYSGNNCIGKYLYNRYNYNAQFTTLTREAFDGVQAFFDAGEAYLRVFSYYNAYAPPIITFNRITEMPFSYDEVATITLPSVEESDLETMRDWRGENNLTLRFNAGNTILHNATIDIPARNGNPKYIYTNDLTGQSAGVVIIPQLPFPIANNREMIRIIFNGEITLNGKTQPYEWQIINCISTERASCGHNGW